LSLYAVISGRVSSFVCLADWIAGVVVSPDLIPAICEVYQSQVKRVTRDDQVQTVNQLERKLSELQEEEARLGRLFITGQIGEEAYAQLRLEWNEKVANIQRKIEELDFNATQYLNDLEVALQSDQTTQFLGLQAPNTGDFHPIHFTSSACWCNITTGTTIEGRSNH